MLQASAEKLIAEFLERKRKNDRYSERAFARSAGLSPAFLKLLFQGKRALSPSKAQEVANRLGWSELRSGEFVTLVHKEKLGRRGKLPSSARRIEAFSEISDWYHFAIVEILKTKERVAPQEIAARLGISTTEVLYSLRALERLGLVHAGGGHPVAEKNYFVPAMSTSAMRKFHSQMLSKARAAVDDQPVAVRELRSLTLAFDTKRKDEAAGMIREFMKQFEKRFGLGRPNKVYQLSLAFFSLEREGQ